ncbi:hypothetical protein [Marinigracilibium pacificum]|uniref:Uncharacterized protein n=1 Tax=Marinigracilibium pacificum TaxID=2729599 RepID=A0A848J454_9BACT|nr:hypothetical protein [Marinigracilibium pacificum]NMM50511.1 hypothetical protein [Marinigracilibium pacificum]
MDILEFLPFIIAIVIYIIKFALKANKESSEPIETIETQRNSGGRPKSFEELLQEIQGNKASQRQPQYDEFSDDYEEEKEVETENRRRFTAEKESEIKDTYRKSIAAAKKSTKIENKNLDKSHERFENFKIRKQESQGSRYKKMLRNSNSAKDAIILSEILNRKEY